MVYGPSAGDGFVPSFAPPSLWRKPMFRAIRVLLSASALLGVIACGPPRDPFEDVTMLPPQDAVMTADATTADAAGDGRADAPRMDASDATSCDDTACDMRCVNE